MGPLLGELLRDLNYQGELLQSPWARFPLQKIQLRVGQHLILALLLPCEELETVADNLSLLQKIEGYFASLEPITSCEILLHWSKDPEPEKRIFFTQQALPWLAQSLHKMRPSYALALNTLPHEITDTSLILQISDSAEDLFGRFNNETLSIFLQSKLGFPLSFSTQKMCAEKMQDFAIAFASDQELRRQTFLKKAQEKIQSAASTSPGSTTTEKKERQATKRAEGFAQKVEGRVWGRYNPSLQKVALKDLHNESGLVTFTGQAKHLETRYFQDSQSTLLKYSVEDNEGAIACSQFVKANQIDDVLAFFDEGGFGSFQAEVSYDGMYSKDLQAKVVSIKKEEKPAKRQDNWPLKRVELHAHTKMSAKDAMADPKALVQLAAQFGHPAVAITDHGVVQGFPEAFETAMACAKKGQPIKLILGMEGYLVPDGEAVVFGLNTVGETEERADILKQPINRFVALDVETTGLDCVTERLIEVGAARFVRSASGQFEVTERYHSFVDPQKVLPSEITKLTGITQAMLDSQARPHLDVISALIDFVGYDPVCAHNAMFDIGFIRQEGFRVPQKSDPHLKFNPVVIDTVALARLIWPELPNAKLNTVCEHLNINLENHHRATDDAIACGQILARVLQREPDMILSDLNQRAGLLTDEDIISKKYKYNHIILLAQNELGLYHLYRLVSASHTNYFFRRPRIPKHMLTYFKHGLIVGSACEAGEVFRTIRSLYEENKRDLEASKRAVTTFKMKQLARYYDYLEIQPLSNNSYLTHKPEFMYSEQDLINLNLLVVHLAQAVKKPVCATCDAHYLNYEDGIFRKIMLANIGFDPQERQPELYFRSTEEMLKEFSYLPPTLVEEFCITNPQKIAQRIEDGLRPFPDGTFPPLIASADREVREMTWEHARRLYEKDGQLPEIVAKRVTRELSSIIDNGFAIMYYIAHKLVKKSNDDGYIVGSRGSVGSSLVASFCGITEVNPLPPHYRCPSCNYSEFDDSGNYGSGFDLPAKDCPLCGHVLHRDGQDIPFETFLGFNGDKQPDIDLNFSGEYQPRAHHYIQEMFGESHTYRAGTIGSYAEKNALALIRKYIEDTDVSWNQANQKRLAEGLVGVKRTTGQHPGGIVVIPKEREIYDFTPIQYPADKLDSVMTTTHFDFNAMHDTILKLDVLGHDDPTMLKVLGDFTGVDVTSIPIPDEKVMNLFATTEALGIAPENSPSGSATLGLPEMGTFMARGMINETKPTRFYDLVQLMGLSHGTDVWKGNAQDLIKNGTCSINEVIGCRDSIMTTLIYAGLPDKAAFDIMEKVRKGKGLSEEHEALMIQHNVPSWYIESCKKIKYMFPKAHAAAYAISSLRIAWFKVYHPEAYYAAYFTVRADEFESTLFCQGLSKLLREKERLYRSFRDENGLEKEKKQYYICELVEEMYLRQIEFLPIDLYKSEATLFQPLGKGAIRPPLNAIPGISEVLARNIVEARAEGPFKSQADLMQRAGIGQSAIATLETAGCLEGMPKTAQMELFDLFN